MSPNPPRRTPRRRPGSMSMMPLWYKDAVIYQLHVKAFFDSNDDGIGDFPGLTRQARLHPRPRRQRHLAAAVLSLAAQGRRLRHRRLRERPSAVRHAATTSALCCARRTGAGCGSSPSWSSTTPPTSTLVPGRAPRAAPGSPERDFYVWSDTDQKLRGTRIIFTDTETSNWTWDPVAKAVLLAPLLQPPARSEFRQPARHATRCCDVMRFWLDMGVDGLRLDAVPYLVRARGHEQREPARDARR